MTPEQQKMVDSKLYTRQPAGEPPVRSSELVRRRPATWMKLTGIIILDPDGWRSDGQSLYKPITREEWNTRQGQSTCMVRKSPNAKVSHADD